MYQSMIVMNPQYDICQHKNVFNIFWVIKQMILKNHKMCIRTQYNNIVAQIIAAQIKAGILSLSVYTQLLILHTVCSPILIYAILFQDKICRKFPIYTHLSIILVLLVSLKWILSLLLLLPLFEQMYEDSLLWVLSGNVIV